MNIYFRKLRGVLGIALIWTPVWVALFFALIGTIMVVFNPGGDSDVGALRMTVVIAWVGFVSGVIFAVLLAYAENGKALGNLSLARTALWGILGSAIFPLLTGRANQVIWTCPFGAIIAVVLVTLARKAELRNERPGEETQPRSLRDALFACLRAPVRDAISPTREAGT
jgi:hypothetical protein